MEPKNKWGIVVGQPKNSYWGSGNGRSEPDLTNVGRWVIGYNNKGIWSKEIVLYDTRREARTARKKYYDPNRAWHYHVKKYLP